VTRRIDKDDLGLRPRDDSRDPEPRRLRLRGHNADLLTHHAIQQRGFAHVGLAHNVSVARAVRRLRRAWRAHRHAAQLPARRYGGWRPPPASGYGARELRIPPRIAARALRRGSRGPDTEAMPAAAPADTPEAVSWDPCRRSRGRLHRSRRRARCAPPAAPF